MSSSEGAALQAILPAGASVAATRNDPRDVYLFPEEEETVADAVEQRRREFATGRACARAALEPWGLSHEAIPMRAGGEPRWPEGIVGSITHCAGYRACAVAGADDLASLGIDAEPNRPLPEGLLADVAFGEERMLVRRLAEALPAVSWDRLLFSAKEAIYKAWFPLAHRRLGFEDAAIAIDPRGGGFTARLPPLPVDGEPRALAGRWAVDDGVLLTTVAVARPPRDRPPIRH